MESKITIPVKVKIDAKVSVDSSGSKSPLASKTVHFNVWTLALWPFLPAELKHDPNAPLYLSAWFAVGNIALRFISSEVVTLWKKKTSSTVS